MKIKKKSLEKIRNWFLVLLGIIFLGVLYRVYVEKDWFSITTYTVVGVDAATSNEIVERLKKVSSGTVLFILPRDKILSYSHAAIVNEISELVPSRKDIIIRPSGLKTLTVQIEEFVPVMKLSDSTGVTKEGVVFHTRKSLEALPLFDSASTTVTFKENGFTFHKLSTFDEKYIEDLSSFLEKVSTTLFPVTKISIDDVGDVTLHGEHNSKVLLTKNIDLTKGWSTLVSAIDTNPLKSSLQKEKEKLLYIDLRFGNKVFYKFGNGEFQNSSSTVIIDDHAQKATSSPL
jgi:hypothetical protein